MFGTRASDDPRRNRLLGSVFAKGLLVGEGIAHRGDVKLDVKDVFWVGENVEPRVFEVLPAALIHFPKTFLGKAHIPDTLRQVVDSIVSEKREGLDFRGMRYRDMRKWANRAITDRRTKPLSKIKRNKTLRLSPAALRALEKRAKKAGVSQTQFVEQLLLNS